MEHCLLPDRYAVRTRKIKGGKFFLFDQRKELSLYLEIKKE